MPDRTINFGESQTEATYQIQDTDGAAGGGNFVVAKDTNANTVLLEYQPGSDTWQYAGDVDMGGGDITNVNGLTASSAIIGGTVTATDVNTDSVNTESATIADAEWMDPEESIVGKLSELGQGAALVVPPGTYQETFEFQADEQTVFGVGEVIVDGGSSRGWEQGVTTDVTDCRVSGVFFQSSGGESFRARSGSSEITASNCRFLTTASGLANRANFVAADSIKIDKSVFKSPNSDVVTLDLSSNRNTVIGSEIEAPATDDSVSIIGDDIMVTTNIIEGTLTDSGTNNETTPNVIY